MKKQFELQKKDIAKTITKMNTIILCELLQGRTYPSIFKTLTYSGYKVKNEEAVRSIIRKLKKAYRVNSLFQLGAFYAIDVYGSDQKTLVEALGKYELKIAEKQKKIDDITYENLDLLNKMSEISNKYEEEKIIAYNNYELVQNTHREQLSKTYARGYMKGLKEANKKAKMYYLLSSLIAIILGVSIAISLY